ncbi:hypothetical protein COCNU_09G002950 [Cocos nucifera]|uniref:Uncharacterized protein n=1 Tax=Cocos nucifera TaxID=13894 RepID=A0A8K0IJ83_COCNU|nr:hypothetical protein COCNU_09G002950 [Cocos nucifera]
MDGVATSLRFISKLGSSLSCVEVRSPSSHASRASPASTPRPNQGAMGLPRHPTPVEKKRGRGGHESPLAPIACSANAGTKSVALPPLRISLRQAPSPAIAEEEGKKRGRGGHGSPLRSSHTRSVSRTLTAVLPVPIAFHR